MKEAHRRTIRFKLNGRPAIAEIATHETLLEVLRHEFSLFGARESCGQGLCGCCTAIVDGIAVSGCLYLAAFVDGAEVPPSRDSLPAMSCTRSSNRLSRTADSNAVFARPGSS